MFISELSSKIHLKLDFSVDILNVRNIYIFFFNENVKLSSGTLSSVAIVEVRAGLISVSR